MTEYIVIRTLRAYMDFSYHCKLIYWLLMIYYDERDSDGNKAECPEFTVRSLYYKFYQYHTTSKNDGAVGENIFVFVALWSDNL